ncbi:MAG: STAS domain-containing protein [Cyanobacteria bacterium P01_H01_bin.74]
MEVVCEGLETKIIVDQDLIATHSTQIHGEIVNALKEVDDGTVVLDISKTEMMDSIGIKVVIGLMKSCQSKGLGLRLDVASANILRLFKICKLDDLLDVREVVAHG